MFILSFLLYLIGCKNQEAIVIANKTFYPLKECKEISDLDRFIDTIEIICPDQKEQINIGDISKVLLDASGNFYILDIKGGFHILNPDGTLFKSRIQRGRAANEYIHVEDIALSEHELLLLDGTSIKCFDLKDIHKTRSINISSKTPFDAIAPYKEGGVYLFSAFPAKYKDASKEKDYLLSCLDCTGRLIYQDILREDCTFSIGNISQACYNTYYLRPQNNNHLFFRLADDGIVPEYCIDFQEYKIPDRYYYRDGKEDILSYMKANYFKLPIYLHETTTHLSFNAVGPEATEYTFLYDKQSRQGIRWYSKKGDPVIRISASDKDSFYIFLPDFIFDKKNDPGPLVKYIQNKLKSNSDGLIILKLKFKKL